MPLDVRPFWWTILPLASAIPALAQTDLRPVPLPSPLRDAGTYHVATGTWTRDGGHESFGAKTLYSNTASTGFYQALGVPGVQTYWTDEGRVPGPDGHPNAKDVQYQVNGFSFAYCSQEAGPQQGTLAVYDCYETCTDPTNLPALVAMPFSAPGGGVSGAACWIVTFDLLGTTDEFVLQADCDWVFDGSSALDDFGWTISLEDVTGGGMNGPVAGGDPDNFPYGDGTYYQNFAAPAGTGLGTVDRFWLDDTSGTFIAGCYWFGGYSGGNSFGSFWLELYGDNYCGILACITNEYCTANVNSTGAPADISMSGTSAAAGDVAVMAGPVPNQPGIFFHGAQMAEIPFGNGYLCTTGDIVRGAITIPSTNVAKYTYDNSDAEHSLLPFVGSGRNFQYWYRDPMGGGAAFNTSNARHWDVQ